MKPSKLIVKNIGIIEDAEIEISQPLLVFYGQLMQGKSTILHAVQWVCGGEFPSDILRHGSLSGHIELQFGEHTHLRREWYLAKDGKTIKARALEFIRDGRPVDKPAAAVEALLNPFTLDQDYLIRKNEKDRNRYFVELFGVDTSEIDTELTVFESKASALRSEIKGFGEIDLTKHEPVDTAALKAAREKIVGAADLERKDLESRLSAVDKTHDTAVRDWQASCEKVVSFNLARASKHNRLETVAKEITELEGRLAKLNAEATETRAWLSGNPPQAKPEAPQPPDTAELKSKIHALHSPDTAAIDQQISDAGAANVRAEQYQKNLATEERRKAKAAALDASEKAIKAKREAKLAKLTSINETCKIEGLKFTADGEFSFEGTTASMLSTSQLMRLSKSLSDLYPPGLGIQLIDRGESLGSSIFKLIDRAKAEEKTVLATVVGERPAVVPEQVGVFVVEKGVVSQ